MWVRAVSQSTSKMDTKLIFLGVLVAYANAGVAYTPITKVVDTEYDHNPEYTYSYGVEDAITGDSKSQTETRHGDVVTGQYSLVDPDGTRRIVDYTADPINGFNAVVRKTPLETKVVAQPVVGNHLVVNPVVAPHPVVQTRVLSNSVIDNSVLHSRAIIAGPARFPYGLHYTRAVFPHLASLGLHGLQGLHGPVAFANVHY